MLGAKERIFVLVVRAKARLFLEKKEFVAQPVGVQASVLFVMAKKGQSSWQNNQGLFFLAIDKTLIIC